MKFPVYLALMITFVVLLSLSGYGVYSLLFPVDVEFSILKSKYQILMADLQYELGLISVNTNWGTRVRLKVFALSNVEKELKRYQHTLDRPIFLIKQDVIAVIVSHVEQLVRAFEEDHENDRLDGATELLKSAHYFSDDSFRSSSHAITELEERLGMSVSLRNFCRTQKLNMETPDQILYELGRKIYMDPHPFQFNPWEQSIDNLKFASGVRNLVAGLTLDQGQLLSDYLTHVRSLEPHYQSLSEIFICSGASVSGPNQTRMFEEMLRVLDVD